MVEFFYSRNRKPESREVQEMASNGILQTVLLLALPASGKSEVRAFLRWLERKGDGILERDFHMGPTVQLDDFPFVNFMRVMDAALLSMGLVPEFFLGANRPFCDKREWLTLTHLLNTAYADLANWERAAAHITVENFMERLNLARVRAGLPHVFATRHGGLALRQKITVLEALEPHLATYSRERENTLRSLGSSGLTGKTLVVEFARGGRENATMPLTNNGYAASIGALDQRILANTGILYVWVTPEQSRAKNEARARPGEESSDLHHSVPDEVMRQAYGCDDIGHMLKTSIVPNAVQVATTRGTMTIPCVRLDNRADVTTFAQSPPAGWQVADVKGLYDPLSAAMRSLARSKGLPPYPPL